MTDFRETLYTINRQGQRNWVYSSLVRGRFFQRRAIVMYALMVLYLSLPWIVVHGEQAVHLDILNRRFVFWGAVFWATDTGFLFLILGSLALSLFFFNLVKKIFLSFWLVMLFPLSSSKMVLFDNWFCE